MTGNAGAPTKGKAAVYALVEGRVQGVGFRYSAYREAQRLGLTGWVRNTGSGAVEALAEGTSPQLEAFLSWLRRGPPQARVDSVRYEFRP
ncbi:MAG: acylphosphatase, partial [Spirochaetaceae bacterium]|nr:acylphosphatase [Spirochaetaceae bacterium]